MTRWEEWMVFTACPGLVVSVDKVKSYFHSYSERYGKLGKSFKSRHRVKHRCQNGPGGRLGALLNMNRSLFKVSKYNFSV